MANRGYKLQEIVAHSGNVNCLSLARKQRGLFITGGDDQVVNLWSIGKSAPLVNLCGHTSPVESVAFDPGEEFVVAGASAGALKLWDLEQAKMVRNFDGHRSYCTAVEFHQSGEFFASGSKDTNLKIWDIRKKERIHMYKGHVRGISTVRFSPDGRWLVSGGLDNVVKIWDLTAGKLLHDLKLHEGHIRSIDFHPMELLMATGSADKTVKFWDLETFELIGSSRPESSGVRSIAFHPEGKTLFSGLDDCLKVYSWEPVVCHDTVDLGWSTLRDLCIQDGKLLGGSCYQNSVGIWLTDTLLVEPYRGCSLAETNNACEQVHDKFQVLSVQKAGRFGRSSSSSSLCCTISDNEDKEVKNIYVDREHPVPAMKVGSIKSSNIFSSSNTKDLNKSRTPKEAPTVGSQLKPIGQTIANSFIVPSVVPRESSDGKEASRSRRESIISAKADVGMYDKLSHISKPSNAKLDVKGPPFVDELDSFSNIKGSLESTGDLKLHSRPVADDSNESCQEKPSIKIITENSGKLMSAIPPNQEKGNESLIDSKGVKPVRYVNGVAVVHGRTRSLVERFERKENSSLELQTHDPIPQALSETSQASSVLVDVPLKVMPDASKASTPVIDSISQVIPDKAKKPTIVIDSPPRIIHDRAKAPTIVVDVPSSITPNTEDASTIVVDSPPRLIPSRTRASTTVADTPLITPDTAEVSTIPVSLPTRSIPNKAKAYTAVADSLARTIPDTIKTSTIAVDSPPLLKPNRARTSTVVASSPPRVVPDTAQESPVAVDSTPPLKPNRMRASTIVANSPPRVVPDTAQASTVADNSPPRLKSHRARASTVVADSPPRIIPDTVKAPTIANNGPPISRTNRVRASTIAVDAPPRVPNTTRVSTSVKRFSRPNSAPHLATERLEASPMNSQPRSIMRESMFRSVDDVPEDLLKNHNEFLSNLRSRLTKLQVMRHFLERNDIKGAINAMQKLPDHSVQAELVSLLVGNMDVVTLDLFSCLLPVLSGLLESKAERHVSVALEMLLKLVAVFGPVIHSTISAPPGVGVNIQAERRLECCRKCSIQLQRVQKTLPAVIRRGGILEKSAQELTLVLQDS
ncbi:katanin p80 WD40 repeat-containing subunit B1 homolog KTN80.1 isoform X2 [Daucus carota subsp. sativus]|uniref:katanin p80 WD40 repeat-containing subunit B1 homolog KTN80.1 isoform X2 n=1 Tax=Daucus carota subsp. sativus TaxID=79200 RepID=UPI0007EEFC97|nr:PREDICTED: katanin p80 WD40 repeat-containing subunit B1 homolog isoform X2 [Daucus carota subsp. sativus]